MAPGRASAQAGDGGAEMRLRRIPEFDDQRVTFVGRLHASALHTRPAPVNQPHEPQSFGLGRGDVLLDHRRNVARVKRVKVERIGDRDVGYFTYSAVTVVVMPPRAEKSPMTFIFRGAHALTRSSRIWLVTAS